jgi:amidase
LTTNGSPIYAEHRAPADDRTVAVLRGNGAIPLAKSNVPEFAGSHTFNPVWGITRNPWNLDGWCRRCACVRRGLARQRFLPRRIVADPC